MNTATGLQIERRWSQQREPVILAAAAGAVDTISFVALYGLFTAHVTGNLVIAGAILAGGGTAVIAKLLAIPVFMLAVGVTTVFIQRQKNPNPKFLARIFFIETAFLLLFMLAGITWQPMDGADGIHTIITGMMGVIAMGTRNAVSRILLSSTSPSTMMTGNVTQLTIDMINYNQLTSEENKAKLKKSSSSVLGFTAGAGIGALGYAFVGFLGLLFPIALVLFLAIRESRAE